MARRRTGRVNLCSRKLIFTNPTRGMPLTAVNATVPSPLDTAAVRHALDSADPAVALAGVNLHSFGFVCGLRRALRGWCR